tara:strand:- start:3278 stop:3637 length:360 start_codon:yes stop_codon:yes gene_type:complete
MARRKSNTANQIGSWSFLAGVVLAVLLGLGFTGAYQTQMVLVVFLLGLVVGLLNVTHGEAAGFLTSGTVLVLVSYLGTQVGVFGSVLPQIGAILTSILTLFVPATIIVALRAVFVVAKS